MSANEQTLIHLRQLRIIWNRPEKMHRYCTPWSTARQMHQLELRQQLDGEGMDVGRSMETCLCSGSSMQSEGIPLRRGRRDAGILELESRKADLRVLTWVKLI